MAKICALCLEKESCKKESHFVPKFLRDDLMHKNNMTTFTIEGKIYNTSDLPKRSFIFCEECESKLSLLETRSSRILKDLKTEKNIKLIGKIIKDNDIYQSSYIIDLNRNTVVFNLFLLSIIWRVSISKESIFANTKLSDEIEENIRLVLYNNMKGNLKEYVNKTDVVYKGFNLFFKKPKISSEEFRGNFSIINSVNGICILNFPYFQLTLINKKYKNIGNINNGLDKLLIHVCDSYEFKEENDSVISKMNITQSAIDNYLSKHFK